MEKLSSKACYIFITLFTFLIFANSLWNDFVFDDESVVQNNSSIQNLSNIPAYFTGSEGFHKVIGRYYRPIVSSTYAIDYAIWKLNPFGFHLTNILIHIIASLILFRIFVLLFESFLSEGNKAKRKFVNITALMGALIFAAHPVHTEAVSWVSGRTDSLVTLFFFASFLYYLKLTLPPKEAQKASKKDAPIEEAKTGSYLFLSLLFYFLGLLSKEMIITMPVIIIMFDLICRRFSFEALKKNLKYYLWFGGITVLYLVIRYLALKDVPERTNYNYFTDESFMTAFATMLKTIPIYFKLLVFPINLLYHYNGFMPNSYSLAEGGVILSILFLLALIGAAVFLYMRKENVTAFAITFMLVSLVPVMNIIPTMNFMAERFLYMTSFGLCLIICYVIYKYIDKDISKVILSVCGAIILIFSFMTFERNKDWKDNNTLYSTAEGVDGNVLLVNVANIYANKQQYDEAEKRYRRAIEIRDKSVLAHHNLGLIHFLRNELDSAEFRFKKGISIDSLAPDGYFMLANLYQREGRMPEAITQLEKLQSITPGYKESDKILQSLKSAPTIPNIPGLEGSTPNNQGAMLEQRSYQFYQQGKYKEAIADLEELAKLNPSLKSGYYNNIALSYQGMGDMKKAEEYYLKAVDADSKNVNALNGLADVYLKSGDTGKAKQFYKKILDINPADVNAKMKLDSLGN